ncbi:chitinase [Gregarina niphandrodes]|uniref:Chitinase n=1 Tax=Gregarina niphandrodes TaxID=110365 RepID=A0A023AYR9_GRENI|nr:chitinase [Gregarina niphandrodes]EZG43779.1 chitinase [Gregarina niphandrodes]|eukprot:XP_011134610.1 chitinase [Gregarina niphandrodes]
MWRWLLLLTASGAWGQVCDAEGHVPGGGNGGSYWPYGPPNSTGAPTVAPTDSPTDSPTEAPTDSGTTVSPSPTASPEVPKGEILSPANNYDDINADPPLQPVDGPTGPSGECVWPFISSVGYNVGMYASVGGKVYTPKWYMNTAPPGDGWDEVGSCTGEATAGDPLTDEEQKAKITDPDVVTWVFDPWTPFHPTPDQAAELQQTLLDSVPIASNILNALRVLDSSEVELIAPGRAENPDNVLRAERIITPELFVQIFPCHLPEYSYENWLKAIGALPDFCKDYGAGQDSDKICKKLIIAAFAHNGQETGNNSPAGSVTECQSNGWGEEAGWSFWTDKTGGSLDPAFQAFVHLRESPFTADTATSQYDCKDATQDFWSVFYPCPGNVTYFGRGSHQVTYQANYGLFSISIKNDAFYLCNNPDEVATTYLNFASGIWFSVTPQSPKPSMVWVLDGTWQPNDADKANNLEPGFGATISIINPIECGQASNAAAEGRQNKLKQIAAFLDFDIAEFGKLDCADSKDFSAQGSAVADLYLKPGQNFNCETTGDNTPFMITRPGDYKRCVDFYFRSHVWYKGVKIYEHGLKI